MKRILAIALIAVFALAACSPGSEPPSATPPNSTPSPDVTNTESAPPSGDSGDFPVFTGQAQPFKQVDGLEFIKLMGSGWNLGNSMDATGGGLGTDSETSWGNPKTTKAMIQLLADSGFKTIRIPITWSRHFLNAKMDDEDNLMEIAPVWMDRVQEIVDYAIDAGLYVIINSHHDTDWQFPDMDNYRLCEKRLTYLWHQIAVRFAGYDERLIFETLNEPRMVGTALEWNGGDENAQKIINLWNAAVVKAIRETGGNNDKRWVMCPGHAASGDPKPLAALQLPKDDYVIASIHSYKPYNFALNTNESYNTFGEAEAKEVDEFYKRIYDRFIAKGIPAVVGETGCLNKQNEADRVAWAKKTYEVSSQYGMPSVWWDNGTDYTTQGEGLGLMNRREVTWWYPSIVDAFVGKG
ncbi:endoglucanase [Clostridia bacterium]|nr:endoglucanase [Clostridia bacterium]